MRKRWFWSFIGMATLMEALAAAALAIAAFSKPIPRGWTTYAPTTATEILGRPVSLDWASDPGLLVSAASLGAIGLILFAVAVTQR